MTVDAAHPSHAELAAFALGKLDIRATESVHKHLEACADCRAFVEQTPNDSFTAMLNEAGSCRSDTDSKQNSNTWSTAPRDPIGVEDYELPAELQNHARYRIVRKLGQGGMGAVYLAEHKMMERVVAIKVIASELVSSPDAVERFHREVRAAAKLEHPNIVRAYDADQAGSMILLAMEFVQGRTLAEIVESKGPLPIPYACNCIRQVALGLQHAADQKMVHRDIKPQNLMLTAKGVVKILDFGLAKLVSERASRAGLTAKDVAMGTPEYMAPEQARDTAAADVRADIYALGCTLFHLLTGRPPFTGGTPIEMITRHLMDAPPRVIDLRPDVPADLSELIGSMLAKNPVERPQTPKQVAEELRSFAKQTDKTPRVHDGAVVPLATPLGFGDANAFAEMAKPRVEPTSATPNVRRSAASKSKRDYRPIIFASAGGGVVALTMVLWAAGVFSSRPGPAPTQTARAVAIERPSPNSSVLPNDDSRGTEKQSPNTVTKEIKSSRPAVRITAQTSVSRPTSHPPTPPAIPTVQPFTDTVTKSFRFVEEKSILEDWDLSKGSTNWRIENDGLRLGGPNAVLTSRFTVQGDLILIISAHLQSRNEMWVTIWGERFDFKPSEGKGPMVLRRAGQHVTIRSGTDNPTTIKLKDNQLHQSTPIVAHLDRKNLARSQRGLTVNSIGVITAAGSLAGRMQQSNIQLFQDPLTAAQVAEKFKGQASLDPTTGVLTLTYDFSSANQLQDFGTINGRPSVANRALVLGPGDVVRCPVVFRTVDLTASMTVRQPKGSFVGTDWACGAGLTGTTSENLILNVLPFHPMSAIPKGSSKGTVRIRFVIEDGQATVNFGSQKVSQAAAGLKAGRISLRGGEEGFIFRNLVISGKVDSEWARFFFGQKTPATSPIPAQTNPDVQPAEEQNPGASDQSEASKTPPRPPSDG